MMAPLVLKNEFETVTDNNSESNWVDIEIPGENTREIVVENVIEHEEELESNPSNFETVRKEIKKKKV